MSVLQLLLWWKSEQTQRTWHFSGAQSIFQYLLSDLSCCLCLSPNPDAVIYLIPFILEWWIKPRTMLRKELCLESIYSTSTLRKVSWRFIFHYLLVLKLPVRARLKRLQALCTGKVAMLLTYFTCKLKFKKKSLTESNKVLIFPSWWLLCSYKENIKFLKQQHFFFFYCPGIVLVDLFPAHEIWKG